MLFWTISLFGENLEDLVYAAVWTLAQVRFKTTN